MDWLPLLVAACTAGSVVLVLLFLRMTWGGYRAKFTTDAKLSLEDMFLFIDPQRLFFINIGMVAVVPPLVWIVTGALPLAVLVAVGIFVLPRIAYGFLRKRREQRLVQQMPDVLNMMAGALRSGASLAMAIDLVATESPPPFCQEMSMVLREQKLGVSLEDSFESFSQRVDVEDVRLLASAVTISKEVGGNLSEVLDRLASTLRAKSSMEGKIKALTSQGKLQGIVVGLLPLFLAFVLFQMEPEAMEPLFTTYYGWAVMAVIGVLLIMGGVFIKKIVTIDV
ncbi:Flp pilus assembly protein TadB [Delftia tsuruhatensis]|uniref:type II secretion system F family protein n=1 Tax=Delftia tsuruhatensis TaxID=180282 RepID=UPI001E6E166C|nr:type II secretion system F family protein [Delftia tsuruhatensis]CAB5691665.1 Flp pilus assembly protein TadB [Delftia tsuruhatensis]CAC9676856.1 Flp pilus assembly protein TadB [Delftia tsuruhatensis]